MSSTLTPRAKVMRYSQVWLFLLCQLWVQAQPCASTGALRPSLLPDTLSPHWLAMAQGRVAIALPDTATATTAFEEYTRLAMQRLITSGRLLDADTLTEYVRRLHGRLAAVAGVPTTTVYLERDYTPNAYVWQSGVVVVTLGLLAQVEEEAQLAFVLAHELAHYQEQHAYRSYRAPLSHGERHTAFELEADSLALRWVQAAGYPVQGIPALLERLQSPVPLARLDWPLRLSTDKYRVSPSATCQYEGFSAFQRLESIAVSGQHFSQRALAQRYARVADWCKQLADEAPPATIPHSDWPCLQDRVWTELVHSLYRASRYEASLYLALRRMPQATASPYLREVVAHSAYALQLMAFAERQPRWLHPDVAALLAQADYAAYCCLLNNLDRTEVLALGYGLVAAQATALPTAEPLAWLRCQSAQLLGMAEPLAESCRAYLSQFPEGAHRAQVQALQP